MELQTLEEAVVLPAPTALTTLEEVDVRVVPTVPTTREEVGVQTVPMVPIIPEEEAVVQEAVAPLNVHLTVPEIVEKTAQGTVEMNAPISAEQPVTGTVTITAEPNARLHVEADVTIFVKVVVVLLLQKLVEEDVMEAAVANAQGHVTDIVMRHAGLPDDSDMYKLKIARNDEPWQGGMSKNITFIVTKDCQLACKYCYLVGKNEKERMSWEVAKKAIDYILENERLFPEESVVWDFIGGEPFLEIELIDRICDYIRTRMYVLDHHWFNSYRFSFSTNGINYHMDKIQRFIEKNKSHISIGITIDGTRRKHDLNRIWKGDGEERGSYDDVVKNIPLWLSQFPHASTKVTISSADIPYICESVLHLYSLGIKEVNINCVFEDVWKKGDDTLFEQQLIELADAIIDNGFYENHACSFFSEHIGKPLDRELDNQNWCGAGKMLSVDAAGNFYPCTRFARYSLRSKEPIIIGNVEEGINFNLVRPFLTLTRCNQSKPECIDCEVASGCAWCQGENYDAARTDTIFERSTAICKMHKARVRANNYYWNKLFHKLELENQGC